MGDLRYRFQGELNVCAASVERAASHVMGDPVKKVVDFIERRNAFEVMGRFRRLGVLDAQDIRRAMRLSRVEWVSFMKEKAGIPNLDGSNIRPGKESR